MFYINKFLNKSFSYVVCIWSAYKERYDKSCLVAFFISVGKITRVFIFTIEFKLELQMLKHIGYRNKTYKTISKGCKSLKKTMACKCLQKLIKCFVSRV